MKKISPMVITVLKDALSTIFWEKKDLRAFLISSIGQRELINSYNWADQTKYQTISELIDTLVEQEACYQNDLLKLISDVSKIQDFSHLNKYSDSSKLIEKARINVLILKNKSKEIIEESQKDIERISKIKTKLQNESNYNLKINEFYHKYIELTRCSNPQERGYLFETFLNDLFNFDLHPRGAFKIEGEQLDGAFTHDNQDYLLEAKWTNKPTGRDQLDIFNSKIGRKLKNTLGLFISINGYENTIIENKISYNSIICMDSIDLISVLENKISLDELIRLKRRHSSETGETMYRINS